MDHTYLRYECADSFGLVTSCASSKAPPSNSTIQLLPSSSSSSSSSATPTLLTTAGSCIMGWNLKSAQAVLKLAHREQLTGGVGTGRALNSNEVTCLDTAATMVVTRSTSASSASSASGCKVATGWIDGSVRVFDLTVHEMNHPRGQGLIQSLLHSSSDNDDDNNNREDEEFMQREPLVLNGHSGSPVRSIAFDKTSSSSASCRLLASGATDGSVILWDVLAETGLFRLLGHAGAITDLVFLPNLNNNNSTTSATTTTTTESTLLVTTSLDALVKIWDLQQQCCIQTLVSRGAVLTASCITTASTIATGQQQQRCRLLTGGTDGQVHVWSVECSQRSSKSSTVATETMDMVDGGNTRDTEKDDKADDADAVCRYMGRLVAPPNTDASNNNNAISCIRHGAGGSRARGGRLYTGILHSNSKTIDIYRLRSTRESLKKRQRRLRRRQEKQTKNDKKKTNIDNDENEQEATKKSGGGGQKKRGMLDDPESASSDDDGDEEQQDNNDLNGAGGNHVIDPERMQASDELEFVATVRASHKIRGFAIYAEGKKNGRSDKTNNHEYIRVVCALSTNALEVHALKKVNTKAPQATATTPAVAATFLVEDVKLLTMDMHGHATGIRDVTLSSDDRLACTVSKNVTKIWNVATRSLMQTLTPTIITSTKSDGRSSSNSGCYGLCAVFLPGNTHVVVGTREGHLLILDIAAGQVVYSEESAHDGAIWSIDVRASKNSNLPPTIVTGSADKMVKFWDLEVDDEDEDDDEANDGRSGGLERPVLVHSRTLQMSDDVVALRYSNSLDPTKRLVFVSTLDNTIKVFFDDSLKLFLSLYGHSLPALAVDASDDDVLLASAGADKTIKIWGLDFGDTHRTLHGHQDSITDLRFVPRTHNFFTSSKDGTVRYWDGDRFEPILILSGHAAEVNSLALSRTGAFVLSASMDRQVRVWERTRDIVFLEEERERELEQVFDRVNDKNQGQGTLDILNRASLAADREDDDNDDAAMKKTDEDDQQPQSEAAVRKSVLSVSSGDRIMEALEKADQEIKETAAWKRSTSGRSQQKPRMPNPMLLGLEPAQYVLWVLKSIKNAELEQSLLILPLGHLERLLYYLIVLLKSGRGIELCSRVAIFMVKTHQNQIITSPSLAPPLRELRRLIRLRLGQVRDMVGYDIAAMRMLSRTANAKRQQWSIMDDANGTAPKDVWSGLGLGSDLAAALEGRRGAKSSGGRGGGGGKKK